LCSALLTRFSLAALLFIAAPAIAGRATGSPESSIEHGFLTLIKSPNPSPRKFEPENAPHWDIAKLTPWLSNDGISFTGPGDSKVKRYSVQQVTAGLSSRKGDIFRTLAQISFLLSHTRKQYSEIKIEARGQEQVVHIATFYELTFKQYSGTLMLTQIKDINSGE